MGRRNPHLHQPQEVRGGRRRADRSPDPSTRRPRRRPRSLPPSGEGDRTGGTPIGLDQEVQLHPGEHFRAIPGNRNFG